MNSSKNLNTRALESEFWPKVLVYYEVYPILVYELSVFNKSKLQPLFSKPNQSSPSIQSKLFTSQNDLLEDSNSSKFPVIYFFSTHNHSLKHTYICTHTNTHTLTLTHIDTTIHLD